jgi:hypothetical protein
VGKREKKKGGGDVSTLNLDHEPLYFYLTYDGGALRLEEGNTSEVEKN